MTNLVPLTHMVYRDHRRSFADNRYVYTVVSRRSKGISIGINLNPDTLCNFNCVYCQVDRTRLPQIRKVDVPQLVRELEEMVDFVATGEFFNHERFRQTPLPCRQLRDIAFSGDGEPTTCPEFLEVVKAEADIRCHRCLEDVKLVLITNASRLHVPRVQETLAVLDANHGEIWAKLDAGSDANYHEVERTQVPFRRILAIL